MFCGETYKFITLLYDLAFTSKAVPAKFKPIERAYSFLQDRALAAATDTPRLASSARPSGGSIVDRLPIRTAATRAESGFRLCFRGVTPTGAVGAVLASQREFLVAVRPSGFKGRCAVA